MKHTRFQYSFVLSPELKSVNISENQIQVMIDQEKSYSACKLGRLVAEHIGFTEKEYAGSLNNKRYELDITAFNTQKWWQFQKDLGDVLSDAGLRSENIAAIKKLFHGLENPE